MCRKELEGRYKCFQSLLEGLIYNCFKPGRMHIQPRTPRSLIVGTLDTSQHCTPLKKTASFAGKRVITNCFQLCEGGREKGEILMKCCSNCDRGCNPGH